MIDGEMQKPPGTHPNLACSVVQRRARRGDNERGWSSADAKVCQRDPESLQWERSVSKWHPEMSRGWSSSFQGFFFFWLAFIVIRSTRMRTTLTPNARLSLSDGLSKTCRTIAWIQDCKRPVLMTCPSFAHKWLPITEIVRKNFWKARSLVA